MKMKLMARQISRMMYDPKEFGQWQEVKEGKCWYPSGLKTVYTFTTNEGRKIDVKAQYCEACYVFEK